ncbi:hypothetical protein DLAC_07895 [Tieghemostelium lacteum]|uniref:Phospholipid/glycerol acyltransferase domain-containing protein n=1 Tax=Tieghemostelium lacteum TaxID=361077 RepID=A0A151ZAM3_TIELA|nr:hypothetical protein DLAC_07895 [Tieghemostelium lacteum]|eukprot:KYQ91002.1 hypothetical protein DLAC_07895 [Tieghemostelium lacteum]
MVVISNYYNGKQVLITGCTGFVGKVLLEKMLRDLPGISKIYLIIRGNAKERFEDDILGSRIWDFLKEKMGGQDKFLEYIRSKVIPLAGDLSKTDIGLSAQDLQMVIENVHINIHCAASIDFRERLDKAIESNLYGSLHMLELSKKLKNCLGFVHCSTAYVNSNREGWLDEELPVLDFNPEEMVELIMKQDIRTLEKITPNLLGAYPNSYTFTKAITERILTLKRGDIPMAFVRPTIVGGSLKEPTPGWVDSVAAIGAVMLYCGVGLVQFMKGDARMIADIVPVDLVANCLIAAAPSISNQNILKIYQCGTSHRNPVPWIRISHWVTEYWRNHTPKKSIAKSSFNFHTSSLMYEAHFFMKYGIPSTILSLMALITGNEETKYKAESFKKVIKAARLICDTFKHFTGHEWVFSVSTVEKAFQEIFDQEDRNIFNCDAAEINWQSYFQFFCYGLHKYVMKEEGVRPPTDLLNTSLITKSDINQNGLLQWIFADVSWAYTSYRHVTQTPLPPRAPAEIRSLVMNSPRVQMAMEKVSKEEGVLVSHIEKRAIQIMDKMQSNLNIIVVRVLGWFLKKVWRKIYHGIHVDEKGIELIREAIQKSPVVLLPSHRSYIDFLIMSYIFFEYNLPLPHIAAGEDFLGIIIVRWFLRNAGAFFLRRSFHGDALYWAIFSEYVQRLVIDNQPVEFFIEGKRSRAGKSLYPKMGMLGMICTPFFENKVPDVHVAPIGISYEKVLEGELYSQEVMGESKTKESFNGLLRASKVLKMNFGRINVVFSQPISIKKYTADKQKEFEKQISNANNNNTAFDPFQNTNDRRQIVSDLGFQIIQDLNKNTIITTTSVVATIILAFRKGINREELNHKVEFLREEIFARGGDVAFEGPSDQLVDHSLKLLSNLITRRRNMYEPAGTQQGLTNTNYKKNILVLSYYRNLLLHLFLWDGLVCCAILSYVNRRFENYDPNHIHEAQSLNNLNISNASAGQSNSNKMDQDRLLSDVKFLAKILSNEFVFQAKDITDTFILNQIHRMTSRGIIQREQQGDQILYQIKSETHANFLSNLFWPLIEGYKTGLLTLFSIQPEISMKKNLFLQRMGWFSEKMFEEGKLNFFESCSMELLNNSLSLFEQMKIIIKKKPNTEVVGKRTTQSKKNEKKPRRSASKQETEIEYIQLLPPYQEKDGKLKDLAEKLSHFRKSQHSDLRKSVIEDFPMLSKL